MTIGASTACRNARLDAITTTIGNAGLLRIYNGTQPATGGAVTTKLAELTLASPAAASASGGVLTFSAITQDSSADATGTASWFRVVKSDGTFVMDGTVTASGGGGDLTFATVSFVLGAVITVTSFALTEGNA